MKGKLTCYLCQRAIAEHPRGQFCWLLALESGAVRPLVATRVPIAPEHLVAPLTVAVAN